MLTAVMVVLGYRVDEASQQIRQYEAVSPLDWENLHVFPDFSDDSNEVLAKRMLRDYPEKDVGKS